MILMIRKRIHMKLKKKLNCEVIRKGKVRRDSIIKGKEFNQSLIRNP